PGQLLLAPGAREEAAVVHMPFLLEGPGARDLCGQESHAPSVEEADFRDRHHEPAAPSPYVRHLLDDLFSEVPRQDEDVVGPRLVDLVRRVNRNVCYREELPLLVRAAIDGEIEEIGADPTIVEERVSLSRGTVPNHFLASALRQDEEVEQLALRFLHLFVEARVSFDAEQSGIDLAFPQHAGTLGDRLLLVLRVPGVNPQRSAVR